MIEILEFMFQDFWHFLGSFILIATISEGVSGLFSRHYYNRKDDK